MTDQEVFEIYIRIGEFIAEISGPSTEVVVHDLTDPQHSVVAIYNSISNRKVGDPVTDIVKHVQGSGISDDAHSLTNYTGKTKDREFLSSTFFIRNDERLIGFLCVNKDLSSARQLNTSLNALLTQFNLESPSLQHIESLDAPLDTMLSHRVAKIIEDNGISPSRMSRTEKIKLVGKMNDDGILLLKGAAHEIAQRLNISIPTMYRYLNLANESPAEKTHI